jgi:membrane-associated phospholipid phosphatase
VLVRAQEGSRVPSPLDSLGSNLYHSVVGWNSLLYVAGGAATYFMVREGTDADVQKMASHQDKTTNAIATGPGMIAGTLAPVLLSTGLYVLPHDTGVRTTGAAAMQAVAIAFLYNNILKAATGRVPPRSDDPDIRHRSGEFHFGFMREGVFYGWPSGHTMVNTAMAASIYACNRDQPWTLPLALGYSATIGASMVLGGRGSVHWASEAVAGFLMGWGIGWVVGDSYYRGRHPPTGTVAPLSSALTFEPTLGDAAGMRLRCTF